MLDKRQDQCTHSVLILNTKEKRMGGDVILPDQTKGNKEVDTFLDHSENLGQHLRSYSSLRSTPGSLRESLTQEVREGVFLAGDHSMSWEW